MRITCSNSFLLELLFLSVVVQLNLQQHICSGQAVDPTKGFTAVKLNPSNFEIQKPYDVSQSDRYSFVNGVHKLWVYSTDKPHTPTSKTKPRTEIGIRGYDYSSGVWQFEANGYVPSGTTGVSIMQVFGGSGRRATTIMLRVYSGSLTSYRSPILVPNIYNKWFKLNVIHDVGASNVKVFIDGILKYEGSGHGGNIHSFKCGVYEQDNSSNCMESRWKDIRVLKKN